MVAMTETSVSIEVLRVFDPLGSLSGPRLQEFADLCFLERVQAGADPFRMRGASEQLAFLAKGELTLLFADGSSESIVAGTDGARGALTRPRGIVAGRAVTDLELIRIDRDLLDRKSVV